MCGWSSLFADSVFADWPTCKNVSVTSKLTLVVLQSSRGRAQRGETSELPEDTFQLGLNKVRPRLLAEALIP